jgi:hypothetical protein
MSGISHLSNRLPVGTKYVLEARESLVHRYIEFPNGRRIQLPIRMMPTCACADASIIPEQLVEPAKQQPCDDHRDKKVQSRSRSGRSALRTILIATNGR